MHYPEPLAKLMESFMKLPGIGEKTASRLAFYTMDMDEEDIKNFAEALISVQEDLSHCPICGNITDQEICEICADESRDSETILVVESPTDVVAFEKVREYRGYYHVLQGVISPAEGKGPNDINIQSLIQRLQKNEEIKEVIIATNATSEGEATAMYLSRLIKPSGIKVTRLAHGLSAGSDIEFADEITLQKAVSGRQEM